MNNRKESWEAYPDVWPTKSAFFAWLRGGLRKAIWQFYPPKIKFKNALCKPPPLGYTGRAKSGASCSLTGEWTGKSMLEVDHIVGHVSLREWDDVLGFIQHLCTTSDNMALVSKEAHKIKSYAERMGISFDEAVIEKKIIALMKDRKKCLVMLEEHGYDTKTLKNETKRREALRQIFKGEQV